MTREEYRQEHPEDFEPQVEDETTAACGLCGERGKVEFMKLVVAKAGPNLSVLYEHYFDDDCFTRHFFLCIDAIKSFHRFRKHEVVELDLGAGICVPVRTGFVADRIEDQRKGAVDETRDGDAGAGARPVSIDAASSSGSGAAPAAGEPNHEDAA